MDCQMAQYVKSLRPNPDDLSFVGGTHIVEGEKWITDIILWPSHTHTHVHAHTPLVHFP